MELFGLSIPDAVVTAAITLYSIVVFVALLACVMKGWMWGKWKWYLLSLFGAIFGSASCVDHVNVILSFAVCAGVLLLLFKKWRKLKFTPVEYLLMLLFAYPMTMAMVLILFLTTA